MTALDLAPEEVPIVVRDTHPANVTLPDGTELRKVRAVLTRERLYVWAEVNRAPSLTWQAPFDAEGTVLPAARSKAWRVNISGGTVLVQPAGGCGCGSPLKLFRPFTPMRRGNL